jgi:hypothetical protein
MATVVLAGAPGAVLVGDDGIRTTAGQVPPGTYHVEFAGVIHPAFDLRVGERIHFTCDETFRRCVQN